MTWQTDIKSNFIRCECIIDTSVEFWTNILKRKNASMVVLMIKNHQTTTLNISSEWDTHHHFTYVV